MYIQCTIDEWKFVHTRVYMYTYMYIISINSLNNDYTVEPVNQSGHFQ